MVYYIDPQSYNNLSVYDTSLLSCIDADLHVAYYHSDKYQLPKQEGINYREVFHYSEMSGLGRVISYVKSLWKIGREMLREHPSVVHIQWFKCWPADCLFILWLKMIDVKCVFTAHNVMPHNPGRTDRLGYWLFYQLSDAVIVHTKRTRDELMATFPVKSGKIHVIPHGMLASTVDVAAIKMRARELADLWHTDGCLVFASMGFQNYYKGADIIVDTWIHSPELYDNPKVKLLMIGKVENADISKLENYSNVVIRDEMVSDLDFEACLQLATVALLPYRAISQSGVLLTVLERGIPVVVSDAGALAEPLQIAPVGWNIGNANVENLRQTLAQLVNVPDEVFAKRQDSNLFDVVRRAYSWRQIGQATSSLYRSL